MTEISLFDAKTHLSSIISDIETKHNEYIITKRGKQVAKIVPIDYQQKHDIASVLRDMDNLKHEIGATGITLKEILDAKSEGRK